MWYLIGTSAKLPNYCAKEIVYILRLTIAEREVPIRQ